MAAVVTDVQLDPAIGERAFQQRNDNPSSPANGQAWVNFVANAAYIRINGITRQFGFVGVNQGQTLYSIVVTDATSLLNAVTVGTADTIYLRTGIYDLTTLSQALTINKSLYLVGEKTGGDAGKKVQIITDSTHFINVLPDPLSVVTLNTVQVTNNSATVSLVSGTWTDNFAGQYFVVNGVYYLISSNTTTQLTLARIYNGQTIASAVYYITPMIGSFLMENIEVDMGTNTHVGVKIQNTIRPVIVNCDFTSLSDSQYGKVYLQNTFDSFILNNHSFGVKVDYFGNNFNATITNNVFNSTLSMGSDPSLKHDTNFGIPGLDTNFSIVGNVFTGPAPAIYLLQASSNTIVGNVIRDANVNPINLDSNSNNNVISTNKINGIVGGGTLIQINGKLNIITDNRLDKTAGFAIDLTSTSFKNTVVGNSYTSGSAINDALVANINRVEDDFNARFGSAYSGFGKDIIDDLNLINQTLQIAPSGLIQQQVAIASGVVNESLVYWDTIDDNYKVASTPSLPTLASVGFVRLTGSNVGNVFCGGFVSLTNSGNPLNANLFNNSYIGQRFFLGLSGTLTPESLFLQSGVVQSPLCVGRLIDIVGNAQSNFLLNVTEDFKYGTPNPNFALGQFDGTEKSIIARSSASGVINQIAYSPLNGGWWVVTNSRSGQIEQPQNTYFGGNALLEYFSGQLAYATSSLVTVLPNRVYAGGYKAYSGAQQLVGPVSSYSGMLYIWNQLDSGVIVSQGTFVSGAALLATIQNSGNVFLPSTFTTSRLNGAMQTVQSGSVTSTTTYQDLARLYVPYKSGTVDLKVEASCQIDCTLTSGAPSQNGRIKLQLNGQDIPASTRIVSIQFISGQPTYATLSESLIVTAYSASGTIHEIKVMGQSDYNVPVVPVNFSNVIISASAT